MAEYLIQDTILTEIANAIRSKTEKTESIFVSKMASEIESISAMVDGYTLFLTIGTTPGLSVTLSKGDETYTKETNNSNSVVFVGLSEGEWTITATINGVAISETINITEDTIHTIASKDIPDFTYTGDYNIVNDSDNIITSLDSTGNWKVRFLTSGTLTIKSLKDNNENGIVDVFLVGGGGRGGDSYSENSSSGGGGGYTVTDQYILEEGQSYEIVIGGSDGDTSAFGIIAAHGMMGSSDNTAPGGAGGSGGGGGAIQGHPGGSGGSDGSDGFATTRAWNAGAVTSYGGKGQGTTTAEFGEEGATLYAGGGGGGAGCKNGSSYGAGAGGAGGGGAGGEGFCNGNDGVANTGGGGGGRGEGGSGLRSGSGGSGIVIIRNRRS